MLLRASVGSWDDDTVRPSLQCASSSQSGYRTCQKSKAVSLSDLEGSLVCAHGDQHVSTVGVS